jgi:rfaE bifunctional protein nucleotidyltransferase chain/domain
MKVVSVPLLLARLERHRVRGNFVVFTNGCFDILHVGHLRTLQVARGQGDLLVVGVNGDASVRSLKGPSRPINSQADRAELLGGLACVDYVVIFEETTPLELLAKIRPDVHVKGGDYQLADLPEAQLVQSYGGRVHLTELVPGRSTTALLEGVAGGLSAGA